MKSYRCSNSATSRFCKYSGFRRALYLSLLIATLASPGAFAQSGPMPITQCGTIITQPGPYIVLNDLSCQDQDGIDVVANNVTLMLNGHRISNVLADFFNNGIAVGVGVPAGNTKVKIIGPATITGFGQGIAFEQVTKSSVVNVTADGNFFGFVVFGGFFVGCNQSCPSANNTFNGNTAINNNQHGFLLNGANTNGFVGNNASNNVNGDGILVFIGDGNLVEGNTTSNNGDNGMAVVGTNTFIETNISRGNGGFDMQDTNTNCNSNTWVANIFVTANQSCIH
jgi:hypothetical protein